VGEQTDFVTNDYEWDLDILYDDKNNVTQLRYKWTTGPRDQITITTVSAYDNKSTPYVGIKGWKFLGNFAWNNYDPEPVIIALSVNNPLDYTLQPGSANPWHRSMAYTYNENGFPVEKVNIDKNANGESTYKQTFTYKCQ